MNIEEIGLTVLLLASQARLLELFRSLEAQGVLQLQVASSITDAERLLAKNVPDIAFIQSRISALSGEIVVRHIRSYLTKSSTIVLLSGDEEELKKAPALQAIAINLGSSDESLNYAVREVLVGTDKAEISASPEATVPQEAASEVAASEVAASEVAAAEEAAPEVAVSGVAAPIGNGLAAPGEEGAPDWAAAVVTRESVPEAAPTGTEEPPAPPEREAEPTPFSSFASAFEEKLRAQQVHEPQPVTHVEAERLAAREAASKAPRKRKHSGTAPGRSLRDFASKNYLAPRRLQRRTIFFIVALLLCGTAAAYFLIGGHVPPAQQKSYPLPVRPAQNPATQPAAPGAPAKNEAMVPEAPPAPSKTGRGLRDLPPFVVDAEQDTDYGKTHPGWERYLTSRMEYKIFREGTLIKAVQILAARDETVPPDIFNWARKEFAGTRPYRLESKEKKGNYLVEKWQAEGAGLTVYRKEPELKMRALVLYFR